MIRPVLNFPLMLRPSRRLALLWTMRDMAGAGDDRRIAASDSQVSPQQRMVAGQALIERRRMRDNAISMLLRGGLAGAILGFFLTGNAATGMVAAICLLAGVGVGWLGRGLR